MGSVLGLESTVISPQLDAFVRFVRRLLNGRVGVGRVRRLGQRRLVGIRPIWRFRKWRLFGTFGLRQSC